MKILNCILTEDLTVESNLQLSQAEQASFLDMVRIGICWKVMLCE